MEEKFQLPEGYQRIEYIEYCPKQERLFAYGQFERFVEAMELANQINEVCKDSVCDITTFQIPNNVVFCVVFPEHVFDIMEGIEKEACTVCEKPADVIYNIPILYRFIEEKYVNMFFEKGTLKLTTFERCKELEDTNRKDSKEGRSELFGYDGKYTMQIDFGVGSDAIMLCTSLCSDYNDDKGNVFNKCIEIFDVQGLLFAIAEQLAIKGFVVKSILFGPCFYSKKELHKEIQSDAFLEKLDKEQVFDWDKISRITNTIAGSNIYFQKPLDKKFENEFRLLWIVDNLKKDQDVFVTIPHPEKYCRVKMSKERL